MTNELESSLWRHVASGKYARDWVVEALADGRINAAKQAHRTLEKWERKGLYDYGVALDLGWVTPVGLHCCRDNPVLNQDARTCLASIANQKSATEIMRASALKSRPDALGILHDRPHIEPSGARLVKAIRLTR